MNFLKGEKKKENKKKVPQDGYCKKLYSDVVGWWWGRGSGDCAKLREIVETCTSESS